MIHHLLLDGLGGFGLLLRLGLVLRLGLGGHFGQKHRVDVGEHSSGRDGYAAEELVELLVVADSQLDVARNDARLLVVTGRVARQLEDLGSEVLEDGAEVDGSARADTSGVLALLQETGDTTDRELETRLGGLSHAFLAILSTASLSAFAAGGGSFRCCCCDFGCHLNRLANDFVRLKRTKTALKRPFKIRH